MAQRGVDEESFQFVDKRIELAIAMIVEGITLLHTAHPAEARPMLFEEVLAILEQYYGGRHHRELAVVVSGLAKAIGELHDAAYKRYLLQDLLAIQEAHYGTRHRMEVVDTLESLARC
jgi:hypothetical protein